MFFNSIDRKPFFTKEDGTTIRDLTQTIFDFSVSNFISFKGYRVPNQYEMRPDLISQASYNNTLYTEIILKYNGISNPFTIASGDVILVPDINAIKDNIKKTGDLGEETEASRLRKTYKYIDPTKAPKKDPSLESFNNRSLEEGALPPNIAEEGEGDITLRNGQVFFGEGIGISACFQSGMSSSEFLSQIIKSKRV